MTRATGPDHERWQDAAGAYVLDALAQDEKAPYEAHLEGCPACRHEVEELSVAAAALPVAATPVAPPPALKERVMTEVRREAELLAAAGPSADRPPRAGRAPRRRFALAGWRLAPVAAALLIAGVLAGVGLGRALDGDGTRTVTATVDREQAPQASARLEIEDGRAQLVAEDLPAPPEGRVYQVWIMRQGASSPEPTPALFLPRRDGTAVATVPGSVSDARSVLVTDEPAGGSPAPTRRPVLAVSPS